MITTFSFFHLRDQTEHPLSVLSPSWGRREGLLYWIRGQKGRGNPVPNSKKKNPLNKKKKQEIFYLLSISKYKKMWVSSPQILIENSFTNPKIRKANQSGPIESGMILGIILLSCLYHIVCDRYKVYQ